MHCPKQIFSMKMGESIFLVTATSNLDPRKMAFAVILSCG